MTTQRRIVRRDAIEPAGDWPAQWPPLLQRVHAARGSRTAQQAMPRLADLLPYDSMSGIDAAIGLLREAIARDAHIVVVGDFDCAI